MIIFSWPHKGNPQPLADANGRAQREVEVVEVQHGDTLQSRDLRKAVLQREQPRAEILRGLNKAGMQRLCVGGGSALIERYLDFRGALHLLEVFKSSLGPLPDPVLAFARKGLDFLKDVLCDNEPPADEPGGKQSYDTPVHHGLRIQHNGLAGARVLAETDIGDDEGEIVPGAPQSENRAEKPEAGKQRNIQGQP